MSETQLSVSGNLLETLLGVAHDKGIVHQGLQVTGYLPGQLRVSTLEAVGAVDLVLLLEAHAGLLQRLSPAAAAVKLPDDHHLVGDGVPVLLERLVVQGDLPTDHLVGLGWPDEEDMALPAYPPHGRVAHASQPHFGVGLLVGPGCRSSAGDMEVTPVVRDFLFRPEPDH